MKQTANYTVIYNDDDIVVLNKRSGLLIAADRYDETAPRLDLLAEKEFGRLYAVHRIDRDTSGCVIYAKTPEAHKNLSLQFENRQVDKTYHCLVNGHPLWQTQTVNIKLLPDGDARHRTVANSKYGKACVTEFRLIGNCGPYPSNPRPLAAARTRNRLRPALQRQPEAPAPERHKKTLER